MHHIKNEIFSILLQKEKRSIITLLNKLMHLEESMVMYGIYNAETLEKLRDTVHHLHDITTPNEKLFPGQLNSAYMWYI